VRVREESALNRLVAANTDDAEPVDVGFVQPELLYWQTDGGDQRGSLT
jgi:hypothetical protein